LSNAKLDGVYSLFEWDLTDANLSGVDLSPIRVEGANFYGANLTGTGLSRHYLRGGMWTKVDFPLPEQGVSDFDQFLDELYGDTNQNSRNEARTQSQVTRSERHWVGDIHRQSTQVAAERQSQGRAPLSNGPAGRLTENPSQPISVTTSNTTQEQSSVKGTFFSVATKVAATPKLQSMKSELTAELPVKTQSIWGWFISIPNRMIQLIRTVFFRLWES